MHSGSENDFDETGLVWLVLMSDSFLMYEVDDVRVLFCTCAAAQRMVLMRLV